MERLMYNWLIVLRWGSELWVRTFWIQTSNQIPVFTPPAGLLLRWYFHLLGLSLSGYTRSYCFSSITPPTGKQYTTPPLPDQLPSFHLTSIFPNCLLQFIYLLISLLLFICLYDFIAYKSVFWMQISFKVFIEFVKYCFCYMFFGREACGILTSQPGIESTPPALEALTPGPTGKSSKCVHSCVRGDWGGRGV